MSPGFFPIELIIRVPPHSPSPGNSSSLVKWIHIKISLKILPQLSSPFRDLDFPYFLFSFCPLSNGNQIDKPAFSLLFSSSSFSSLYSFPHFPTDFPPQGRKSQWENAQLQFFRVFFFPVFFFEDSYLPQTDPMANWSCKWRSFGPFDVPNLAFQ